MLSEKSCAKNKLLKIYYIQGPGTNNPHVASLLLFIFAEILAIK